MNTTGIPLSTLTTDTRQSNGLLPKKRPERIKVECLECGKKFSVGPRAVCPECPKCHGLDVDVRS